MTIAETLAVFVGLPVAVIALVALAVYVPSRTKRVARYRPGIAMPLRPVWFVAGRDDSQSDTSRQQGVLASPVAEPTPRSEPSQQSELAESIGGARASW